MGQLIKLPTKVRRSTKYQRDDGLFVEKLPNYQNYTKITTHQFTCATCKHVSKFDFTGLVLRDCSFYCSSCGTGYKVENPVFTKGLISKIK